MPATNAVNGTGVEESNSEDARQDEKRSVSKYYERYSLIRPSLKSQLSARNARDDRSIREELT